MIADSYLQLRNELETAVAGLLKLAGEMRRTPPWLDMLQGFLVEIRAPVTLLVLGESGVGKSTLLNALFGAEFASGAGKVRVFQYAKEEATAELSDEVREIYLPLQFLRDFRVIDTPGLEQMLGQDRQLLSDWLAKADVVVLVFSMVQPWSTSAWQLFDLPGVPTRNFVFVLQQADLREPREIEIIRDNLEDAATQKLGFTPPIYTVSASDALLVAKNTDQVDRPHLVEQFNALLQQITLVVTQSGGRTHKLRPACQLAQVVLHDIASGIRSSVDAVAHDENRVARVQAALQAHKQRVIELVAALLNEINAIVRQRHAGDLALFRRKLSPLRPWTFLQSPKSWFQRHHAEVEPRQLKSIDHKIDDASRVLETELRGLWPQLHDLVDQQLVTAAKENIPSPPEAALQPPDLLAAMRASAKDFATVNFIDNIVAPYRPLLVSIRAASAVAVVALLATFFLLKMKPSVAAVFGATAGCAAMVGVALSLYYRRRIVAAYEQRGESLSRDFIEKAGAQLDRSLESFYGVIAEVFAPLSEFCADERRRWEPFLHRAEKLQRALAEIAARLR